MRRILAGLVAGAAGASLFVFVPLSRGSEALAGAIVLGVYGLIDRLGLLPPPFEPDVQSILHADEKPEDNRARRA